MRYLALDIGNVLLRIDEKYFIENTSEILNISTHDVERFMRRFWELHDIGYTNLKDELIDKLNVKSEIILEKINNLWLDMVIPDDRVINMIEKMAIHPNNTKIALLSNIGIEHAQNVRFKMLNIYDNSIKFFSCEVGARKPSYVYYQTFLNMHPEFKGCLYIDDLDKNLDTASLFGFKPYKFCLTNYLKDDISYGEDLIKLQLQLNKLEDK